jgi:hypothetical protein
MVKIHPITRKLENVNIFKGGLAPPHGTQLKKNYLTKKKRVYQYYIVLNL